MRLAFLPVLLAVLALLACSPGAHAWVAGPERPHHADLAQAAAERLPEPERALVLRHLDEFRRGAIDPDYDTHTFFHAWEPADGGGGAVYMLQRAMHEAAMAMRDGRPEAEVAYLLGRLTHYSMDLAVPFHTAKDAYGHPLHTVVEIMAYDRRDQVPLSPGPAPSEVSDVEARAKALAEESAKLLPPLLDSLERADGAWSPEAGPLLGQAASLGVAATADLLHTTFLWGDPARPAPAPPHADDLPVPKDMEDVGWAWPAVGSPRALTGGLVLLLAGSATAYLVARRRAA